MYLGRSTGDTCLTSAVPPRTTPGMGVYAIDDHFDEAGHTNPLPTADDDEDPQEVCRSGEGCWVRLRGAGLGVAFVAGEDSGAMDDMLFCVYTDASDPSTLCGPASMSSALIFLATVDPHRPVSFSPHPSLRRAYPPPLYHPPLEPTVTGAANAASTSQSLSLNGENLPLSNASNPHAVCYHWNQYSDVIPVLVGLA